MKLTLDQFAEELLDHVLARYRADAQRQQMTRERVTRFPNSYPRSGKGKRTRKPAGAKAIDFKFAAAPGAWED